MSEEIKTELAESDEKAVAKKAPTSKIKWVGPEGQSCLKLAQHGYRAVCEADMVYELPKALAASLVKSNRHFVPAN